MDQFKVFISYSHADEWLKNEFLTHLSALKRNGTISVWHDRMIPPGGIIDEQIDQNLHQCDLFLMMISSDFINSDYCYATEYKSIIERKNRNEVEIVPVLVRECDWDVGGLRSFNALPPDAIAVTKNAIARADAQSRDAAWVAVINGIKRVIVELKKKITPPSINPGYLETLFEVDTVRHPQMKTFDERRIWIDPIIYSEKERSNIAKFDDVVQACIDNRSVVIHGADRSGKSLISKMLQCRLFEASHPSIRISGADIKNADIISVVKSNALKQLERSDFPLSKTALIIDDFDECRLNDRVKENIIQSICRIVGHVVLLSFSNAPSFLFALPELPSPLCLRVDKLNRDMRDAAWNR